ncbi:MAG: EF-Tu/IF-2/RF-3 family GTPase, partial [Candidatus Woesearchaeota archaeon]
AAGRLFSGTIKLGDNMYMNQAKKDVRIQQVSIYKGAHRVLIDSVPAGNIIGLVGLKGVYAGETLSTAPMETFEALKHLFDPVVTKSISVKNPADLTKLIDVLKHVAKEDPSIKVDINEETGENLISGMGELHLEIIENRIKTEKGLTVNTSPPIVVYREAIQKLSPEGEGKSPNKHNRLYFTVEPLPENIKETIKAGELPEMRLRQKDNATYQKIIDLGIPTKDAKNWREIFRGNVLIDATRGIVHIGEIISMVMDGFEEAMNKGGLAQEPCMNMMVKLKDCKLHEDAIHRGPAQMLPAIREGIREAIRNANPLLYEPLQELQIECPAEYMGTMSSLVQNKRGQLRSMDQEGEQLVIKALIPVAELIGWSSELRSATSGRGNSFVIDQKFDKLPESLQQKIITQIRTRKNLGVNE